MVAHHAAAYGFEGMCVLVLLIICSAAYLRRVPRIRKALFTEKTGVWGVFYKGTLGSRPTGREKRRSVREEERGRRAGGAGWAGRIWIVGQENSSGRRR